MIMDMGHTQQALLLEVEYKEPAFMISSMELQLASFLSSPGNISSAFGAIQKGIFVSCAAGNEGPFKESLSNEAPWILTPTNFSSTLLPLIYAGSNGSDTAAFCDPGSLKDVDVKGKVVLCESGGFSESVDKGQEVKNAGGAAMIVMNDELSGNITTADFHVLPASDVTYADGSRIIVQRPVTCSNSSSIPEAQLNYPSFSIKLGSSPQTYTRTVTNVGPFKASYTALHHKMNFPFSQGYLNWVSADHVVRNPIAVTFE
ncbi:hypothetical protein POTOM_004473 [Populus tomentosa]|uniref:Subtilase family protein n=1 Tax=Populus tomentosa TaxID=118781 RepID=A0A8X8DDQ5_POPTO|nr:hypothetical protein POTOM_004473 [Populus tomentosa]